MNLKSISIQTVFYTFDAFGKKGKRDWYLENDIELIQGTQLMLFWNDGRVVKLM